MTSVLMPESPGVSLAGWHEPSPCSPFCQFEGHGSEKEETTLTHLHADGNVILCAQSPNKEV